MSTTIPEYAIYKAIVSKKIDDKFQDAVTDLIYSRRDFVEMELKKIDKHLKFQDGIAMLIEELEILSEPINVRTGKRKNGWDNLLWISPGVTLGQILIRAFQRIKGKLRDERLKRERFYSNGNDLKNCSYPNDVPVIDQINDYDPERIKNFQCTVREFASILGKRYSDVLAMVKEGTLKASQGRIRAFQALKTLGEPTPTIDSILALKAFHGLSKAS